MSFSENEFRSGLRRQKLDGGTIASLMNEYKAAKKEIKEGARGTLIGGELSDERIQHLLWDKIGSTRGSEVFDNLKSPTSTKSSTSSSSTKKPGFFARLFNGKSS